MATSCARLGLCAALCVAVASASSSSSSTGASPLGALPLGASPPGVALWTAYTDATRCFRQPLLVRTPSALLAFVEGRLTAVDGTLLATASSSIRLVEAARVLR